jgi:uncharacterized membrane protein
MSNTMSWIFGPQLVGLIFLIVGSIQRYFPPKHINQYYGYRMPSAQKSQAAWDEANRYSAIYMMKCAFIVIVAGLVISLTLNSWSASANIKFGLIIFLMILSAILPAVLMIIATEKHMAKTFDH